MRNVFNIFRYVSLITMPITGSVEIIHPQKVRWFNYEISCEFSTHGLLLENAMAFSGLLGDVQML